jgi:hypothetical protein
LDPRELVERAVRRKAQASDQVVAQRIA